MYSPCHRISDVSAEIETSQIDDPKTSILSTLSTIPEDAEVDIEAKKSMDKLEGKVIDPTNHSCSNNLESTHEKLRRI